MSRTLIALAFLLPSLACGSDSNGPSGQATCAGNVTVAVSSGTTPTISWTPACSLFFVLVEEAQGDVWGAITDGTNAIETPVQYGVLPPGASELTPPVALIAGTQYTVSVFRWEGPGPQDGALIGQQIFTP